MLDLTNLTMAISELDEDERAKYWLGRQGETNIINELGIVIENNRPVVSSRKVAEVFEKEHKHVMRDIKALDCDTEFNQSNFGLVEYRDAKGEMRPEYLMTRDGFTLLAMGFTGAKAMQWQSRMTKRIQHSCKTS